ncbi:hypothetical protein DRQ33_05515 [bacterium]|nr:MAG: hypothetical protein DRQ33_05515 [bacterium]
MNKRFGKRLLKSHWELLTGEWICVEQGKFRAILEMIGETLQKIGIPWNVKLISTEESGFGAFGFESLAPGSASTFGDSYGLFVPQKFGTKAIQIIHNLKKNNELGIYKGE